MRLPLLLFFALLLTACAAAPATPTTVPATVAPPTSVPSPTSAPAPTAVSTIPPAPTPTVAPTATMLPPVTPAPTPEVALYDGMPQGRTAEGFFTLGNSAAPVTLFDYSDFL